VIHNLHAIERWCSLVGGGIQRIAMVDPNDLVAQPSWHLVPEVAALSFKPGKTAWAFEHQLRTARLEDDTVVGEQPGDYISYTLTAGIRPVRADVELLRQKLLNRRIHLVVRYMDGYERLLPFARLRAKSDSGARRTDRNGYQFTATGRVLGALPRLATSPPITGGGTVVPPPSVCDAAVEPVVLTVSTSTYTYNVPSGKWLLACEMRSTAAQQPSIGLSGGGNEVDGPVDVEALQVWVADINKIPTFSAYTLHFSGLAGTNTIKLWLLE
jgi:hypothetical protein